MDSFPGSQCGGVAFHDAFLRALVQRNYLPFTPAFQSVTGAVLPFNTINRDRNLLPNLTL
jgi:hypothetical protein